jgi:hypothetical protein
VHFLCGDPVCNADPHKVYIGALQKALVSFSQSCSVWQFRDTLGRLFLHYCALDLVHPGATLSMNTRLSELQCLQVTTPTMQDCSTKWTIVFASIMYLPMTVHVPQLGVTPLQHTQES